MRFTTKGKIAAGVASTVAGAALVGSLVVIPAAKAAPGPEDGADFGEGRYQMVVDQEDAKTDANGKVRLCLNEQPVDVKHIPSDEGYADNYAEPVDVTPEDGAGADDGLGIGVCGGPNTIAFAGKMQSVLVDLAGNLDNPDNSPTETQTRFNEDDGAVLVFLKNGEPVKNSVVRFTYVAVGSQPSTA